MNWLWFFLALGSLIILVLSIIAVRLVLKVNRLHKERASKLKALDDANLKARIEQREWLNNSIQILAQALHNDELTLTEACIRITGCLDSLGVQGSVKEEFSAFYQLREKTSHIPYLEAWKELSKSEQNQFEIERLRHESTFNDFVMDAAQRIQGRAF